MLYGERYQRGMFPERLTAAGFAVPSIDLRDHGETSGEVDRDLAISDLQQVWKYFASQDEAYAANSPTGLEGIAAGESLLIIYQDAGHRTLMLRAEPALSQTIIDCLSQHLE